MLDKLASLGKENSSRVIFLLYYEESSIEEVVSCPKFMKDNEDSVLLLEKNNLGQDCDIISNSIYSLLEKNHSPRPLNDCLSIARSLSFKTDLDEFNILKCELQVESIVNRMRQPLNEAGHDKSRPLAIVKNRMLPLQGDPWSKWARAKRELHSLELKGFDNMKSSQAALTEETYITRQNQVDILRTPSTLLKDIFNHCRNYGQSGGDFFVIWKLLQNEFDSLSKAYLPPLYDEYRKLHALSCSSKSETKSRSEKELKSNKNSLKEAAKNITESSLGIEHVFRELGQVFEAYQYSERKKCQHIERTLDFRIRNLDDIFASLLVEGHAFEILDGDVNHVPIEWVTSVLQGLALKIGRDKRIFVLSILGTQSTGKSTLLNTMFGANFPVSSGRCTRGIFMQLIPIAEDLRPQLRYDYLVLLDTEGLRAPELSINSSYKRDNELATFAVGLGDATVINMYGEGHSDVQDILQIIVFAFIRMKETYSKPRCMFVHQNVPDTHAHTNLLTARSNLMKTLNKMTECAAQQENKVAYYKQFCDVIEFYPEEEVFYFPGLFEGKPPRNKISSHYAESASKLREYILKSFSNAEKKTFLTVEEWCEKLNTLWKAVLQENFVFSYRNALEVTARFELDHELSCWHSKYIQAMTRWKTESVNLIFNADLERLEETWETINTELRKERINPSVECNSQKTLMKLFFSDHDNVEILTQWKEDISQHIKKKRESLINDLEKEYQMIYRLQQTKKEMDQKFTRCRKDIISKVNSLFNEMKDQGKTFEDKSLIESSFQKIWSEWKSQIEVDEIRKSDICVDLQKAFSDSPIIKSMNVVPDKSELLINSDRFLEIGNSEFECLSEWEPSNEPFYFVWNDLLKKISKNFPLSILFSRKKSKSHAATNRFKSELQIIGTECERCFSEYLLPQIQKVCPYDPNSFFIVIGKCYEILNKHNTSVKDANLQQSMEFTTDFIFDYIFYQSCKAIPTFEKIQDNFITRTSLDFKFNLLEQQLKVIFIRLCEGIQNEHSCALELTKMVFEGMQEYLSDSIPDIYLTVFLEDPKNGVTYQSRASLILTILKDLANNGKFEDYISYINDPFNYMIVYTQNQLKNHFKEKKVQIIMSKRVSEKVNSLAEFYFSESLNSCFDFPEDSSHSDNWKLFKTKFHSSINHNVRNLSYSDLDVLDVHTIQNYEQFCKLFSREMIGKIATTDWNSWIEGILEGREYLYKSLTDPLIECNALCPFCKEPCQLAIGYHEHYCGTFHRPKGVNGWRHSDSREIFLNDCTTGIKYRRHFIYGGQNYEYINYKTVNKNFESWKILGDDALDSKYWQWVLYTFEDQFVQHYGIVKNQDISKWRYLTKEQVVKDLEMHYKVVIFRKN